MQTIKIESKYFLCTQLTRAARKIVAHYNRELAKVGLTAQQLIALGILILEEDISLGQFAKRLKMGKAGAATMVTRLEALGLVTKEPDPQDGRLNIIKLTDKARELHANIQKTVLNLEGTIESQMGATNLEEFASHLSTFLDLDF
ncbi:Transcriptional regulator, MarR family [uncultured Desulfobacterium sp.]|uniref:Transcriptional regulator, MarR family n=1 Tax=uncultured Desulfobacterium sp. TaxID=201089 RepID=A0A445N296_9BACT|nr:Transcriptional regulator, MarR family [uncultured Desulfobacterium sp.]